MTITEFLLARIGEDEKRIRYYGGLTYGTTREWAECAAKRTIIALHPWTDNVTRAEWCKNCDSDAWPCGTVAALAAVYAYHPDYDTAWRV